MTKNAFNSIIQRGMSDMKIKVDIANKLNRIARKLGVSRGKDAQNGLGMIGVCQKKWSLHVFSRETYKDSLQKEINKSVITIKKLKKWLTEEFFIRWGVCDCDLSNKDLSKLTPDFLRGLTFNTNTKWPKKDKMPAGFEPEKILVEAKSPMLNFRELHELGIDGRGVEIAYIDSAFENPNHVELENANILYTNFAEHQHFHGDCVMANLCGKTVGVAPNANVSYYAVNNGGSAQTSNQQIIKSLQDIAQKIQNGTKIKAVGRSGPIYYDRPYEGMEEDIETIKLLINQLDEEGCRVIDSEVFGKTFQTGHYFYDDDKTDVNNIKRASWLPDTADERYKTKVILPCGGKVVPDFKTNDGYKYEQIDCFSWTIPQAVGMYALCLQLNPDLTYNEFVEICQNCSTTTSKGYHIANPVETVKAASKLKSRENN